jgi:hypothetical protein
MSRQFIELVIRARRFVTRAATQSIRAHGHPRRTAGRQMGGEITQFSFRLALVIDLTYIGIGALGGAAVERGSAAVRPGAPTPMRACATDSTSGGGVLPLALPNARPPARANWHPLATQHFPPFD